jgi:hypothetical protein
VPEDKRLVGQKSLEDKVVELLVGGDERVVWVYSANIDFIVYVCTIRVGEELSLQYTLSS